MHAKARVLLILLSPLALFITLFSAFNLLVNSEAFRDEVEVRLNAHFAGTFHIDDLQVGVDPRKVDLYGVRMVSRDHGEVIQIEQAHLRISALALLEGRVHVSSAAISGARASLIWDERGGFSIDRLFDTGPAHFDTDKGSPVPFSAENVGLEDVDVTLRFPDFELHFDSVSLDDFSIRLDSGPLYMQAAGLYSSTGDAAFEPEFFHFEPGERPDWRFPVERVEIERWRWRGDGFSVGHIGFEAMETDFDINDGLMDFAAPESFDYQGLLRVSPSSQGASQILSWFMGSELVDDMGLSFELPPTIEVGVHGTLGAEMSDGSFIKGGLDVALEGLSVGPLEFEHAEIGARLVNRRLYLTRLGLEGYGGVVKLAGDPTQALSKWVSGLDAPPKLEDLGYYNLLDSTYHLPLAIEGLDLVDLIESFDPEATSLGALEGKLDGALILSGRALEVDDRERLQALSTYHRLNVTELILSRDNSALGGPRSIIPARRVGLSGKLLYKDGLAQAENDIVVALGSDRLAFEGLEFDARGLSTRVRLHIDEVRPYAALHGLDDLSGDMSLSFLYAGPWLEPLIAEGNLQARNLTLDGVPFKKASARFDVNDGVLKVREASLAGPIGRATLSGQTRLYRGDISRTTLDNPTLDARYELRAIDLARLNKVSILEGALGKGASGLVNLRDGRLKGSLSALETHARLETGPIRVGGQRFHRARAGVSLDLGKESLALEGLELQVHRLGGQIKGDVDWQFKGPLEADLVVKKVHLSHLTLASSEGIGGLITSFDFGVRGRLSPDALRRTGPWGPDGSRTHSGGDVVSWLTTQSLEIEGGGVIRSLSLQGQRLGNVYGAWRTREDSHALSLAALPKVAPLKHRAGRPVDIQPPLISAEIEIPLTLPDPDEIDVTARVHFNDLNVRRLVRGWVVESERSQGGWAEQVRAPLRELLKVDLKGRKPAKPDVAASPFTLASLDTLMISGEVDIELDRRSLSWEAYGTLERLAVSAFTRTLSLKNNAPVEFSYRDENLTIGDLSMGGVTLSGDIAFGHKAPRFDLFVRGLLDMRLLNVLPEFFTDLKGEAHVDLAVKGFLSDPPVPTGRVWFDGKSGASVSVLVRELKARAVLDKGTISLCPPYAVPDSDPLWGSCGEVSNQSIVIDEADPLRVRLLDGVAEIHGALPYMSEGKTSSVHLKGKGLRFGIGRVAAMTLHPDLSLKIADLNKPETWALSGRIEVEDGRFVKRVAVLLDLNGEVPQFAFAKEAPKGGSLFDGASWVGDVGLDVELSVKDGFGVKIDGDVMAVELDLLAGVRLKGTLNKPNLSGTLSVVPGGFFLLPSTRYEIVGGRAEWDGDPYTPKLSIRAEANHQNFCASFGGGSRFSQPVSSYQVTMLIEGRVGPDLDFGLTSLPHAEPSELLFMSLLGCTGDQLGVGTSIPGLSIALQPLVARAEEELNKALGVDTRDLGTSLQKTQLLVQLIRLGIIGLADDETITNTFQGRIPINDRSSIEVSDGVNYLYRTPIAD